VIFYADTSALVKLVVAEAETAALRSWIETENAELVSSDLARTELLRAVRRVAGDRAVQARAVLDSVTLVAVRTATFESAGQLDPTTLRTLDALHIASALELGDDLAGLITYDDRLGDAARSHGIAVVAPG
jgi:predicted nucleic acid-binding protein